MKSSIFYNVVSLNTLLVAASNFRRQDNGTSDAISTVAPSTTFTAAASTVTATGTLFDFETTQLETSGLAQLNASMQALFAFGEASTADAATIAASRSACKVFPGDSAWPADDVWDIFNDLLGGALIKTVPIASSCYNDWDYVSLTWSLISQPFFFERINCLDEPEEMLTMSLECRYMCLRYR